MPCLICERIEQIKEDNNPYFVKELDTSYVVLADSQYYEGYTLLLSKTHCRELHELGAFREVNFLLEMAYVARAVHKAFKPNKLNYELLGNKDPHLHWHIIPRNIDDPRPMEPIWVINKNVRDVILSGTRLEMLKSKLLKELEVTS